MSTLAWIGLPLLLAYGDTFKWIWDRWMENDSYYSHGPVLPVLAAVVIYLRREELAAIEPRPDPRGWWLLALGLLMRAFGAAVMVDSISAASLTFTACGAVWLAMGTRRLRALLPVLLLIVFATPPPLDVTGRMAVELKEFAVDLAVAVGNGLGLGAVRQGANLYVPGQSQALVVADACGGLRSLVALTTLGYVVAFFFGPNLFWRRAALLVAAVPLAVATNVVRIVGLCFLARMYGVPFAGDTGHTIMNVCAWSLNLGLLLAIDVLADRFYRRRQRTGT